MKEKKKATFSLPIRVLAQLGDAVARGAAPSKSALVEQALIKELDGLRRQSRRQQWEQAARDPLFLRDIEEIEAAFRYADAESAREIR